MLERLEALAREAYRVVGIAPRTAMRLIAVAKAAQRQVDAYDAITKNRGIEWPGTAIKEHEAAEEALRLALAELSQENTH